MALGFWKIPQPPGIAANETAELPANLGAIRAALIPSRLSC